MKQAMEGAPISRERGSKLLRIARQAVQEAVAGKIFEPVKVTSWLEREGASFVTLRRGGAFRGCVGSLEPHRSLLEDLRENAYSAALRDPRFPPVSMSELAEIEIEVSILSDLEPIPCETEEALVEAFRPAVDGVVLEYGDQRGTLLPQVWEILPEPRSFLVGLKQKVGLDAGFWHEDLRFWRYTVDRWCQADAAS